jgi:hypothetical protein
VAGTEVDDAASPKKPPYAPRHLPSLIEFLARQTSRVTDGACDTMKEGVVGKTVDIPLRQTSAGR